ncbi:DUF5304 domain-containing protein [Streptomyces sp. KR80]|uniref:DUF5304 domain-containing protein n=1 Tax=Streptomyces sp. KR80 TaxID=3457426 RepID=UPI003FD4B195
MSDATERPAAEPSDAAEADAWAKACAEDLAAERARRRGQQGAQPGTAAEELRKLADAVAEKLSALQAPLGGSAAAGAVQQLIAQAKAAVEPVVERNPEVFGHLAAAGSELLAAYRAAVEGQERRWTRGDAGSQGARGAQGPEARKGPDSPDSPDSPDGPDGPQSPEDPDGPSGTERIDLD